MHSLCKFGINLSLGRYRFLAAFRYLPSLFELFLFPSKFKTCDVKIAILFSIVVVMVNHFGGDVGSASFASSNMLNVFDGEAAHSVAFDFAVSVVEINNVFVVEGFNDRFFLGAKKGDEVVFGDEVVHSVGLCHG